MGKFRFDDDINKKKQLPAIWRGIGCSMFILLPIISYLGAAVMLEIDSIRFFFYGLSPQLFGKPSIPPILWKITAIVPFLQEIRSWTNLEVNLIFASVILLVLSGIIGAIYGAMYRAVNPNRYGPTDAPPSKRKVKKHSR